MRALALVGLAVLFVAGCNSQPAPVIPLDIEQIASETAAARPTARPTETPPKATRPPTATRPTHTPPPTATPRPTSTPVAPLIVEGQGQSVWEITLSPGVFVVTFSTAGYGIVDLDVLEGQCGPWGSGGLLFNVTGGDASRGASTVFHSDGCRGLLEISNVRNNPWYLRFQQIN